MILQPNLFPGISSWLGMVGQRMRCELRLLQRHDNESGYYRFLYIFVDPTGNSVVWKTEIDKDLTIGDEFDATFTVKSHGHFRGVRQTSLARPRLRRKR